LVGPVDRGVRFNPEGCIWWAEDADTPLARRLWADGLLG
jgi:hypothetical protein